MELTRYQIIELYEELGATILNEEFLIATHLHRAIFLADVLTIELYEKFLSVSQANKKTRMIVYCNNSDVWTSGLVVKINRTIKEN